LLADNQADGRGQPVVRGLQVENRWYAPPISHATLHV